MTTAEVITLHRWCPEISFGTRLREARLAWGRRTNQDIDQEAFADVLGVKRSTLGAWERGTNVPDPKRQEELAYRLEEKTGLAVEFLLGMTERNGGPGVPSTPSVIDGSSFACKSRPRQIGLATVTKLQPKAA